MPIGIYPHKREIAIANLKKINNKGNKLSQATKDKISLKHKGKKLSQEHKNKLSLAHIKEGKYQTTKGYIMVLVNGKYEFEHRLVMEAHLGRFLTKEEVVHHRNEIITDNRIENLELFKDNSEHLREHKKLRCKSVTENKI